MDPITTDLDLTTMNPGPTNPVPDPIVTDPETTTTDLDRITIPDPFVLKTEVVFTFIFTLLSSNIDCLPLFFNIFQRRKIVAFLTTIKYV